MLGGMFKRKDKKGRSQDKDTDDGEKISSDSVRSPTPKESMESLSQERQATTLTSQPHRQTSKLQKQPPAKLSPKPAPTTQFQVPVQRSGPTEQQTTNLPEPERTLTPTTNSNGSTRLELPELRPLFDETPSISQLKTSDLPEEEAAVSNPSKDHDAAVFSPFVNALRSESAEPKPLTAKRSRDRMQMDDFDSTSSSEDRFSEATSGRKFHERPAQETASRQADRHVAASQANQHDHLPPHDRLEPTVSTDDLSGPIHETRSLLPQERTMLHQPPPLITDTSSQSQDSNSPSPVSPVSSSGIGETSNNPSPINHPDPVAKTTPTRGQAQGTPADSPATANAPSTATPSTTHTTPTWSDASLRAYLEDDSEIRDLLIIVNDKTGVKARKDHPVVQGLFKEENRKLSEIERRLDGLLGDFLGRRGRGINGGDTR